MIEVRPLPPPCPHILTLLSQDRVDTTRKILPGWYSLPQGSPWDSCSGVWDGTVSCPPLRRRQELLPPSRNSQRCFTSVSSMLSARLMMRCSDEQI